MPTYKEIIKFEEAAAANVVRLIRSGEFYRAYNRSAWLFQCCINEHKVIRKHLKGLDCDIYYVGFPEKSLFSNIGERDSVKTEHGFDIVINEDEMPDSCDYDTWKNNVEVQHSSKDDYYALPLAGIEAEREVIKRIREFPLEAKSMVDCAVFLSELRKLLAAK